MSTNIIHTQVDGQRLKLTNLDKMIYPSIGVTKAQVVQYYLDIGEHMLKYVADRALTLIRFPDGVSGKSFYSKDKPKWTPKWIDSVPIRYEDKTISYIVVHNRSCLVH